MSAILSSISSSSKLFTYISKDNRIHLWDTESKKEKRSYVEKHHLSHQYTCFDWKQLSADNLGLFAVGCSDGTIVIWDLVRGIVVTTFKIGDTNSNITSVVFASDATSVFVSDEQNSVHQYLIESGELLKSIKAGKKSIQKLALNPRVDVLAVAR